MKKKKIIIISSIICALTLCVCIFSGLFQGVDAGKDEKLYISISKMSKSRGSNVYKKGSINKLFSAKRLKNIAEESVGYEYDLNAFMESNCLGYGIPFYANSFNLYTPSLTTFNNNYPIEYMEKISKNRVVVVYKTRDNKDNLVYTYVFFGQKMDNDSKEEYWHLEGRVLFAENKLSRSDFNSIEIGSSVQDVYEVDSVTSKYMTIDDTFPMKFADDKDVSEEDKKNAEEMNLTASDWKSHHILTDGIITFTYHKNDAGVLAVVDINYSPDYNLYDGIEEKNLSFKVTEKGLPV